MSDIQQKIINREGMLLLEKEGWVTAKKYDEETDRKIGKNWEYWQKLEILEKPIHHDYKLQEDSIVLMNETEKKDYWIENFAKIQLINKYKNTEKAITDPTENAQNYENELAVIQALQTRAEVKEYCKNNL